MNDLKSCYQILGVNPNTSLEEIKEAYKDLIQVWHPDRYIYNPRLQQKAEEQSKNINLACEQILEHLSQQNIRDSEKHTQGKSSEDVPQAEPGDTTPRGSQAQGSAIEQFVMNLFRLTPEEQVSLEQGIKKFTNVDSWKLEISTKVATIGGLAGVLGGPIGFLAVIPELRICKRAATTGCFGIGRLLECNVDYDLDGDLILAIWVGEGEIKTEIPAGKVGVRLNNKAPSKSVASAVTGLIVSKLALKGSTKLLAKLTSKIVAKAVAKISTKLAIKTSATWIPVFGGVVSGGINVWLVGGLLKAAEQYYAAQQSENAAYFVIHDNNFVVEV